MNVKVDDLLMGHKFVHMDSGREVIRVMNDLNPEHPEWRSCTVFYGTDGKWTGGRYETLTEALLASYEAMPLVLEYDEPEAWQKPGGPSWYEFTYGKAST